MRPEGSALGVAMQEPKSANDKDERSKVNYEIVQRETECTECPEEEGSIQTEPIDDQITPLVQRQIEPEEEEETPEEEMVPEQEEEEEPIQTKANSVQTPVVTPRLASKINSIKGEGQPLPKSIRNYFEPRFGSDFSRVRIHTDKSVSKSAREVSAHAYTVGHDVVFGEGQFAPNTTTGKRLIAHELTHVIQQSDGYDDYRIPHLVHTEVRLREPFPEKLARVSTILPPPIIRTRTLLPAPDGTPDTRKTVGVNEQVKMTCVAWTQWTATCGTFTHRRGGQIVIWTAPPVRATCFITARAPSGKAVVRMTVIPPSNRDLHLIHRLNYNSRLLGSGFIEQATIMPTNVSFSRIRVREEPVKATATGYYNTVLGWNNLLYRPSAPDIPDYKNKCLPKMVGTNPPGTLRPSMPGQITWSPIWLSYSVPGSSNWIRYDNEHLNQNTYRFGLSWIEETRKFRYMAVPFPRANPPFTAQFPVGITNQRSI